FKADKVTPRDLPNEAINNLKKQSPKIQDVDFKVASFLDYKPSDYKDCIFYLDPPYRDTLQYSTGGFPYEEFDKWAIELAKNNTVLISEYTMPENNFNINFIGGILVSDFDKATTKQKIMIEHNKRFLNTKLDNDELETISKVDASEMIKAIIINKERYYTEMVDF